MHEEFLGFSLIPVLSWYSDVTFSLCSWLWQISKHDWVCGPSWCQCYDEPPAPEESQLTIKNTYSWELRGMHSEIQHSFISKTLPRLFSCAIPLNIDANWEAELRLQALRDLGNDCKLLEIIALLWDTRLNPLQKQVTAKMLLTVPNSH